MASTPAPQLFRTHVAELRRRIFCVVLTFATGSALGYVFYNQILAWLLYPLQQPLYYSNPAGGFSFGFQICCFFGILVSLPMASYQLMRFIEPALPQHSPRFMVNFMLSSCLLSAIGVGFAYYLSLPAALHFLNTFAGNSIHPLISTDAYFSFVMIYLGSFAVLFQVPIIMLLLNRFFPLRPRQLWSFLRWIILISFIVAAIITPTPDPLNQTIMALPIILLYAGSVLMIHVINSLWQHRGGADTIPEHAYIVHIAYAKQGLRQGYLCSWKDHRRSRKLHRTFIDEQAYMRLHRPAR